jgi:hypothetical protein
MKTVFVSGHMHVTDSEFDKHYRPRIEALLAVEGGTHFLVGDAPGFDVRVQGELADSGAKVTVYHMKTAARHNVGGFATVGGFDTAEDRDAAMTAASDEDLAWVRPGRDVSGVGRNVKRRGKVAAPAHVVIATHDEGEEPDAPENDAYNKAWGADGESEEDESEEDESDEDESEDDESEEDESEEDA